MTKIKKIAKIFLSLCFLAVAITFIIFILLANELIEFELAYSIVKISWFIGVPSMAVYLICIIIGINKGMDDEHKKD